MINPSHLRLIATASYARLIAMKNQDTIFTTNEMFRPGLNDNELDLILRRIDEFESTENARLPAADWIDPRATVPKGAE